MGVVVPSGFNVAAKPGSSGVLRQCVGGPRQGCVLR